MGRIAGLLSVCATDAFAYDENSEKATENAIFQKKMWINSKPLFGE